MNRKVISVVAVAAIVVFIGYIVYDLATGKSDTVRVADQESASEEPETGWIISDSRHFNEGRLTSVHVTDDGNIICAGEGFISCFDNSMNIIWRRSLADTVYSLAGYGETIWAGTREDIMVIDSAGEITERWGPYDEGAIITSLAANEHYLAIADAGNLLVFIVDRTGALVSMAGHPGTQFIVPSPYFDIYLTEKDTLVVANTGRRSLEFRNIEGELVRSIGEEGDEWDEFCGCCNPSHFTFTPDGNIITAEKGINRIKIISPGGRLLEPVAQPSGWANAIPVDLAGSADGRIYAANSFDSKLYIFERIN